MNLFYSSEINPDTIHFVLPEEESLHCIRVLRMKKGDKLFLSDGKGMFYECIVEVDHPKKCQLKVVRSIADKAKRNFHLTIAIAPTKNIDRFEWFLEKAAEIGCDVIIPIQCRHSERSVIKTERLVKVLVSAMKQCLKSQLPVLRELISFKEFIESHKNFSGQKFIGHIPELSETEFPPERPQGKLLSHAIQLKPSHVLIAIGPEGGFSEDEIGGALKNDFIPISLGNSRLRVETAGIVACSVANSILFG